MITYKNAGEPLDAESWNSLFSYLDGLLTDYLGGLSNLFVSISSATVSSKVFYFFDPINTPASQLHPLAPAALISLQAADRTNASYTLGGFLRLYNQSAIEAQVASWPIDTAQTPNPPQSDDFQIIRLIPEGSAYPNTAPNWNDAVYPEHAYGVGFNVSPKLDICLSVLTRTINGKPYAITIQNSYQNSDSLERSQPFEMVEFIVKDELSIDPSWNKYSMFRIHNFGLSTISVNGVSIPSGRCKCLRRQFKGVAGVGGSASVYSYVPGYNYFQKMVSGDARFYYLNQGTMINPGTGLNIPRNYCPVLAPSNALALPASLNLAAGQIDPVTGLPVLGLAYGHDLSKYWDLTTAESALWPPISFSAKIFDLLTHKGDFKVQVTYPQPTTTKTVKFSGWDNLSSMFTELDSRFTFSFDTTTRVCTLTTNPVVMFGFLTDIGTNLWRSLTSQNTTPAHSSGGYIGQTIGSLNGGSTFTRTSKRKKVQTDTQYLSPDRQSYITVTNYTTGRDGADTTSGVNYYVTDPVSIVSNKIGELNGGLVSASSIALIQTAFGPAIYWTETYPINSYFSFSFDYLNKISFTIDVDAKTLAVKRGFLVGVGFAANQFPALIGGSVTQLSQVHFPRQARVYSSERAVTTIADSEPWNAKAGTSAYFALISFNILSS